MVQLGLQHWLEYSSSSWLVVVVVVVVVVVDVVFVVVVVVVVFVVVDKDCRQRGFNEADTEGESSNKTRSGKRKSQMEFKTRYLYSKL